MVLQLITTGLLILKYKNTVFDYLCTTSEVDLAVINTLKQLIRN